MAKFTHQILNGLVFPSTVVLVGSYFLVPGLLPVAIVVCLGLCGYSYYDLSERKVLKPKEFQQFPLVEKKPISPNTAVYKFQLPTNGSILGLPIGQHISIRANIGGQNVLRSYTPISSDDDKGTFDMLIKSYPQGNISKLVGEMRIGESLEFQGPKGAMVYTPNMKQHIGMIAGGSGVTPMWQIINAIHKGRPTDTTEVDFIFANVNDTDILMKKQLDAIAAKDKRIRIHYVLNNPPEGWKGYTGFVTPEIIKKVFPGPAAENKVLICGPPPMVKAMKTATEELGYEKAKALSKLGDQVFCF